MSEPVAMFPPLVDPLNPQDWERRAAWVRSLHPQEAVYDADLRKVLEDIHFKDAVDTLWRYDGVKWWRHESDGWKLGIPPSQLIPQAVQFTPVPALERPPSVPAPGYPSSPQEVFTNPPSASDPSKQRPTDLPE